MTGLFGAELTEEDEGAFETFEGGFDEFTGESEGLGEGVFEGPADEYIGEGAFGEGAFGEGAFGEGAFGEGAFGEGIAEYPDPQLGTIWSVPAGESFESVEEVVTYPDSGLGYIESRPGLEFPAEVEPEVFPPDTRRPIRDTRVVPFRWICLLDLDFGPDPRRPGNRLKGRATGTLISPRHVLTAGHALFKEFPRIRPGLVRGVTPGQTRVSPGHNGVAANPRPLGSVAGAKFQVHPQWRASRLIPSGRRPAGAGQQFDYGLLTLASPIGAARLPALGNRALGFWGSRTSGAGTRIAVVPPASIRGKVVCVSGYPSDRCGLLPSAPGQPCPAGRRTSVQFVGEGRVTNPSPGGGPRLLLYTTDTFKGQSGAPVWTRRGTVRTLVGVHTGPGRFVPGERPGVSNRGVRLTSEVLRTIRSWM